MAVVENAGVELGRNVGSASSNRSVEEAAARGGGGGGNDQDQPKHNGLHQSSNGPILRPHDQGLFMKAVPAAQVVQLGFDHGAKIEGPQSMQTVGVGSVHHQRSNGGDHDGESFNRDMRELRELFSKLNPMAEEFVPPSLANNPGLNGGFNNGFGLLLNNNNGNRNGNANGFNARRRNSQGKRRMNSRTSMAQREDRIRKTVYVSDIDQQVTEEQLAALFVTCGQVVDCRICGDPNSVLRFAFIEFTDEEGARAALSLAGTMLGFYPVRVLPSKTAIAPVNPTFLPRSDDEREICARTIYCTNIDKKFVLCRLLKLMLNSFLNQSVERFIA